MALTDKRTQQQFSTQPALPKGAPAVPSVLPVKQPPAAKPSMRSAVPTRAARPGGVGAPQPAQPAQAAAQVKRQQQPMQQPMQAVIPGAVLPVQMAVQPAPAPAQLTPQRIDLLQQLAATEQTQPQYPAIPKPPGAFVGADFLSMPPPDAVDAPSEEKEQVLPSYNHMDYAKTSDYEEDNKWNPPFGQAGDPKKMTAAEAEEAYMSGGSPAATIGYAEFSDTWGALDQDKRRAQDEAVEMHERRMGAVGKGGTGSSIAAVQQTWRDIENKYAELKSDAWREMLFKNQSAEDASLERGLRHAIATGDQEAQERAADKILASQKKVDILQQLYDAPDLIAKRYGGGEWAPGAMEGLNGALSAIAAEPDENKKTQMMFEMQSQIAVNEAGLIYYTGDMPTLQEKIDAWPTKGGASTWWVQIIDAAEKHGIDERDYLLLIGINPGSIHANLSTPSDDWGLAASTTISPNPV